MPMKTVLIRLSATRSAHGTFGWFLEVQGSRVVKSVAPARVSAPSFLSSRVNSACSPRLNSPRNASPIRTPFRATIAPTLGATLPGSPFDSRESAIARSISSRLELFRVVLLGPIRVSRSHRRASHSLLAPSSRGIPQKSASPSRKCASTYVHKYGVMRINSRARSPRAM